MKTNKQEENKKDTRYQHSSWLVKRYRDIKYFPYYLYLMITSYGKWAIHGFYRIDLSCEESEFVMSRWESAKFIYSLNIGMVQSKKEYYYTMEEVFGKYDENIENIENPDDLPKDWD